MNPKGWGGGEERTCQAISDGITIPNSLTKIEWVSV